ncbi:MAG: sugar phosphate nucleotidyltransferase [Candidatus Diapherotrites archaeon]|nr:sugar phosphate nucleotidyltransferase [Candidatus Diapherotrites archaeon]
MGKGVALVFLVAGVSSRFGGRMKQFARVGPSGETLIEFSLNQALKSPFGKIIFVVGEKTEKPFKEKFGNNYKGVPVFYAKQTFDHSKRGKPWGTLDAMLSAKENIKESFVVCTGDDIYGEKTFKLLYDFLSKNKSNAAVVHRLGDVIPENGKVNRGIIFADAKGNIVEVKEFFGIEKSNLKESGLSENSLTNMLIFGFQPEILGLFEKILVDFKEANKDDQNAETAISNSVGALVERKNISLKKIETRDKWFGVTNPGDEEIVRAQIKKFYF